MPINSEGRAAFHSGIPLGDVPYQDHKRRIQWLTGWFVSKRDAATISAAQGLSPHVY